MDRLATPMVGTLERAWIGPSSGAHLWHALLDLRGLIVPTDSEVFPASISLLRRRRQGNKRKA